MNRTILYGKQMKKIIFSILMVSLFIFVACTNDNGTAANESDGYDRTALTNSWINDMLIPAITDLEGKLETLDISAKKFVSENNQTNLDQLRSDWLSAYKVWQHVHVFLYGTDLEADLNTYPIDLKQVTSNVAVDDKSTISMTFTRHNDAQGFPAIDYLINGVATTDAEIIEVYQDAEYGEYLELLTGRMLTLVSDKSDEITSESTANINDTENVKTSYFNEQINDIIEFTEQAFRENKIATPSGTRQRLRSEKQISSGVTILPLPESVEARYSSINSKDLYLEAYTAIQNVYYGNAYTDGSDTEGIQDYIQFLGTTILLETEEEIELDAYIVSLFDTIDTANTSLTDNFYEQTQDYNTNFDAAFDAIQDYVEALKVNTLDAFNITVDFVDSDGD